MLCNEYVLRTGTLIKQYFVVGYPYCRKLLNNIDSSTVIGITKVAYLSPTSTGNG